MLEEIIKTTDGIDHATASNAAPLQADTPPENETEFERITRLKLNTDEVPHSGVINDDIANILKNVKLPERNTFKAGADTKAAVIAPTGQPLQPPAPSTKSAVDPNKEQLGDEPVERSIVTASRTLKDDLQTIVRQKKISYVRAAALEQDKKRIVVPTPQEGAAKSRRTHRTVIFLVSIVVLVGLGAAALYGVSIVAQSKSAAQKTTSYSSIIFSEQTETLPLDNTSPNPLKASIAQSFTQPIGSLGTVTRIVPTLTTTNAAGPSTVRSATLAEFSAALGIELPAQLVQGLGDSFFFGVHTVDNNAPLLVLPVTDYSLAFAGMLAWEPRMNTDLAPIFTPVPALITGSDGVPTKRLFQDDVMRNFDVRELKNDSGAVVLYYSFPTPNILVIAESPYTFTELLTRLQARGSLSK